MSVTEGLRVLFSRRGILPILGACLIAGTMAWSGAVSAQKGGGQGAPPQVALTAKQIEGFIASFKALAPLFEKLATSKNPDPKLLAQVETLVKKSGFSSLDEYDAVANSINAVLGGVDPKTRQYSDPIAGLKKDLAEVQADKTLKPADRKKAIQEINQALAEVQPVQHPGNIPLVLKYFDQLNVILPSDDGKQGGPPPPPQQKGKR